MSSLADRIATAFGEAPTPSNSAGPVGETSQPAAQNETVETASTPSPEPTDSTETNTTTSSEPVGRTPEVPSSSPTSPIELNDLETIKRSLLTDHPELEPVVTARFREIDRIVNKKLEQLAALRKEAAEQVVREEQIKGIPEDELRGFAQLYQTINYGTPQQKAEVADYLFQVSENIRSQSVNTPAAQAPDWRNTPEWQQIQQITQQQKLQQIESQVSAKFTELQPEYAGQPIPQHQRDHVLEVLTQRNLPVEDISMVWRSLYGYEFAKQEGIKKGQQLRKEKEHLGVSTSIAPTPGSVNTASKPKTTTDAVASLCDRYGIK